MQVQLEPRDTRFDLTQVLAYCGAAVLSIGVFLPLVQASPDPSLNFLASPRGEGGITLLLVSATVLAIYKKRFWALAPVGVASLALLFLGLAGAGGLIQANESAQLLVGGPVLVIGALLLVGASEVAGNEGALARGPQLLAFVVGLGLLGARSISSSPSPAAIPQKRLPAETTLFDHTLLPGPTYHFLPRPIDDSKGIKPEPEPWPQGEPEKQGRPLIRRTTPPSLEEARREELERRHRREREEVRRTRHRLGQAMIDWHPVFEERLQGVLRARRALYEGLDRRRLDEIAPQCEAVRLALDEMRLTEAAPDPVVKGLVTQLVATYRRSAQLCGRASYFSFREEEKKVLATARALGQRLRVYGLALPAAATQGEGS